MLDASLVSDTHDAVLEGLSFQESVAFAREDALLRRTAKTLYPVTPHVVRSRENHKKSAGVCLECGDVYERLSWCGVPLCIPCWRKKAGRDFLDVAMTVQVADKRRTERNMRPGTRHVVLTERSGPSLVERSRHILDSWQRLRHTRFWRHYVEGEIVKLETTRGAQGWHVHIHILTTGSFIPKSDKFKDAGAPDGWDLVNAWTRATRGEGYIVDVSEVDVMHDPIGAARELSKYVAKPFIDVEDDGDDKKTPVWVWDEETRLELAKFLVGGERVRWYCPIHQSRSRRGCEEIIARSPHPRSERRDCQGAYRRERVGLRHLRYSGTLRLIHREVAASWASEKEELVCRACGKGRYVSVYAGLKIAEQYLRWGGPEVAEALLDLMKAYKSASETWTALVRTGQNPRWEGPTGKAGPPPRSRRLEKLLNREPVSSVASQEIVELVRRLLRNRDLLSMNDSVSRQTWREWDRELRDKNWVVAKRLLSVLEDHDAELDEAGAFYEHYVLTGTCDAALHPAMRSADVDAREILRRQADALAETYGATSTAHLCRRCGAVFVLDVVDVCDPELGGCGRRVGTETDSTTFYSATIGELVDLADDVQDPVVLEAARRARDILHVHRQVPLGYLIAQVKDEVARASGRAPSPRQVEEISARVSKIFERSKST